MQDPCPDGFKEEFNETFKEKKNSNIVIIFAAHRKKKTLNSFYEFSIYNIFINVKTFKKKTSGVPIVAQWKQTQLVSMRIWV